MSDAFKMIKHRATHPDGRKHEYNWFHDSTHKSAASRIREIDTGFRGLKDHEIKIDKVPNEKL